MRLLTTTWRDSMSDVEIELIHLKAASVGLKAWIDGYLFPPEELEDVLEHINMTRELLLKR